MGRRPGAAGSVPLCITGRSIIATVEYDPIAPDPPSPDRSSQSPPASAPKRTSGSAGLPRWWRRLGRRLKLSRPGGRRTGGRGVPWRRILKWGLPVVVVAILGVAGGITFASAIRMPQVRSLSEFTPSLITELHDCDGGTFATFSLERRVLLTVEEVPDLLKQAVVASEDQGFYEHGGVDPLAILRAQWANWRAGEITEGASTLTMQLAREVFLTQERTWSRKIAEALYAVELEKHFSKEQILTLYLNLVNVGNGNYGMAAAARDYFGKDVGELSLPEVATLVGILPPPAATTPIATPSWCSSGATRCCGGCATWG